MLRCLYYVKVYVSQSIYQKHLGIILSMMSLSKHLQTISKWRLLKFIRLLDSSVNYKSFYQEPP